LKWLQKEGGLLAIQQKNIQKANLLYQTIDGSGGFYVAPVKPLYRSLMNVVFRLKDENLNPLFLEKAQENQLMYLNGHTALGGMRASIYNAMPLEGVQALSSFMKNFAKQYG
jgi:phosphoserine aminotransferase